MTFYQAAIMVMAGLSLLLIKNATAGDELRDRISQKVSNNQSVSDKQHNWSYSSVKMESEMGRIRKELEKNLDDETRQQLEEELAAISVSISSDGGNTYIENSVIVPPGANVYGDVNVYVNEN